MSFPASQAMTASTANSGRVCSHARIASARPCEMRNCAASAPHAMMKADSRTLGNVQRAERVPPAFAAAVAVPTLVLNSFSIIEVQALENRRQLYWSEVGIEESETTRSDYKPLK